MLPPCESPRRGIESYFSDRGNHRRVGIIADWYYNPDLTEIAEMAEIARIAEVAALTAV
jgi:hypothetical protein